MSTAHLGPEIIFPPKPPSNSGDSVEFIPEIAPVGVNLLPERHTNATDLQIDISSGGSLLEGARKRVESVFSVISERMNAVSPLAGSIAIADTIDPIRLPAYGSSREFREVESEAKIPKIEMRNATLGDLDTLVDIDMQAFRAVYQGYEVSASDLRSSLRDKFKLRLEKLDPKWIQLATIDGTVKGFIIGCPTSKDPVNFTSWEDTTDNGTLATTYDPNGENVYVVSLSVLPEAAKLGAHNMLQAKLIGTGISEGYKRAFFESRLPGLKKWSQRYCKENGIDFTQLTDSEKDGLANKYMNLTKVVNGKEVKHDRLLRIYEATGCKFHQVVRDAYQDEPSLNYGVMCTFENPIPGPLQRVPLISKTVGMIYKTLARSPRLMNIFS